MEPAGSESRLPVLIESPALGTDYELIASWIRPKRLYPGDAHARIVDSGVPVWALVGHYRGSKDAGLTADEYRLPREAVAAAIAYYRLHRDLIDARLLANSTVQSVTERTAGMLRSNVPPLSAEEEKALTEEAWATQAMRREC